MIEIRAYNNDFRSDWNRFLESCKNRHFMFNRGYMEYHAEKYVDHSQMIYHNDKLIGLLPANLVDQDVVSHGWLTFGGVLCNSKMTTSLMLAVFDALIDSFRSEGIERFIYKAIPHIYHQQPAEEDLYALFRFNAELYRRDVSAAIDLRNTFKFTKGKKWSINKANKVNDLAIMESENIKEFWDLLASLLDEKYGNKPVHTVEEMIFLKEKFPNSIRLYIAELGGDMIGGTLLFHNERTIHTQYIASDEICRDHGGLDALFSFLLTEEYSNQDFFNFGISNEQNGWYLNEGLAAFKEGFGARALVHDFYRINIS